MSFSTEFLSFVNTKKNDQAAVEFANFRKIVERTIEEGRQHEITAFINLDNYDVIGKAIYILLFAENNETTKTLVDKFYDHYSKNNDDMLFSDVILSIVYYSKINEETHVSNKCVDDYVFKMMDLCLSFIRNTSVAEKLFSTLDFKKALIIKNITQSDKCFNYSYEDAVTRATLFSCLSDLLFKYNRPKFEEIFNDSTFFRSNVSAAEEFKFIQVMSNYVNNNELQSDEVIFLENVSKRIFDYLPTSFSDKIEGHVFDVKPNEVIVELENQEYNNIESLKKINVRSHGENVLKSLKHYHLNIKELY